MRNEKLEMPAKRLINGGTTLPLRGVSAIYRSLAGIDGVNEKLIGDEIFMIYLNSRCANMLR